MVSSETSACTTVPSTAVALRQTPLTQNDPPGSSRPAALGASTTSPVLSLAATTATSVMRPLYILLHLHIDRTDSQRSRRAQDAVLRSGVSPRGPGIAPGRSTGVEPVGCHHRTLESHRSKRTTTVTSTTSNISRVSPFSGAWCRKTRPDAPENGSNTCSLCWEDDRVSLAAGRRGGRRAAGSAVRRRPGGQRR